MANAEKRSPRFADVRARADGILSQNGNRLLLIEALSVCLLFVGIYVTLSYAVAALTLVSESVVIVLIFCASIYLLTRLLVAPTLLGLIYMAVRMCRGQETVLADLFYFLCSGQRYKRALRLTRLHVYFVMLSLAAIMLIGTVYTEAFAPSPFFLLLSIFAIVFVGALCVLLLCAIYPRLCWGVDDEEEMLPPTAQMEARVRFSAMGRGWRFVGGFFGWILLGLLTFGLLLVADVLPRMLLTYCCDCNCE